MVKRNGIGKKVKADIFRMVELFCGLFHDSEVDHFCMVKSADDTSLYTTIRNPNTESIAPAVIGLPAGFFRRFEDGS